MNAAATATSVRNGNMMRVRCTVSSNLPGTAANSAANRRTSGSANTMPSDDEHAGDEQQRVDHRVGEVPRAVAAVQGELPREGRDERRAHGAFGEQVADEVGDAEGDAKRVRGVAGAEVVGEHLIPHQPENAAGHRGQPEDPGGAGQAWVESGISQPTA